VSRCSLLAVRSLRTWRVIGSAAVSTVAVALIAASGASAAGPDPVGPPSQSLADGCQRNIPGLLTFTSPEWVYVHSYDSQFQSPDNTRLAEGIAHHSHPAEDDLPQGHQSFDLNFNLAVDPQYQDLLGGDPSQQTGNYAPGDEQGSLHMEWESEAIPSWAWPTENDRIKTWGSWIWDCGHWGVGFPDYFVPSQIPYNGPVTGERTEFHSIKALVVTRANPSSTPSNETQTDVFASTDGRRAHAQEQCAHDHPSPIGSTTYGADYTACVQLATMNKQTVNDRNYSFFVPAPPKPSAGAKLTYRIVDRQGGLEPPETVTPTTNGINVTINYQGSAAPAYGKTFYVGWSKKTTNPDHLQVTVNSIKVNRSLDPNPARLTQSGTPPGEYNLYLDANGNWKYINDWAPGLLTVLDGQTFSVNRGTDFYVQAGKGVRVFFTGRECDFVGVNPCPQTPELSDQNDRPGDILQTFPSVSAALGRHTVQSDMSTPSILDPTVLPNYQLTYTVSRVAG
jgi:hypothetical protein